MKDEIKRNLSLYIFLYFVYAVPLKKFAKKNFTPLLAIFAPFKLEKGLFFNLKFRSVVKVVIGCI